MVICTAEGPYFARERLMAFTLWHPDAVSGSHPPHLFIGKSGNDWLTVEATRLAHFGHQPWSKCEPAVWLASSDIAQRVGRATVKGFH